MSAAPHALAPPGKGEGPANPHPQAPQAHTDSNAPDSALCADATRKRLATATARAALLGITLQAIDDDFGRPVYIANLHALTRSFDDLEDVERWLQKIGAP